jgi:hypothetical protein
MDQAASWESSKGLSLLEAHSHSVLNVQIQALIRMNEMGKRLPELLTADARLPQKVLMVRTGNSGAVGFYPNFAGVPMIRHLLRTRDPRVQ